MFETAFKHLPTKPPRLPLVGSVNFNDLKKIKRQIIGQPIRCQCGAVLTSAAEVKQDPKWKEAMVEELLTLRRIRLGILCHSL